MTASVNAMVNSISDRQIYQLQIEIMNHVTATLQSVSGYKALVRRFVDLVDEYVPVVQASIYTSKDVSQSVESNLTDVNQNQMTEIRFRDHIKDIPAEILSTWKRDFPVLWNDVTKEAKHHMVRAVFQEHTYWLCELPNGEKHNTSFLVLVLRQKEGYADRDEWILQYMTQQLQSECRWYKRLDHTQALLYKDDLTDLHNYRYFEVVLDQELARAQRFESPFCLLFIDLDGFKPVNDIHGHQAGSQVLKDVAKVIQDAVREIDIAIRYGGDEFIVVLLGASSAKGTLAAERLRKQIEQTVFHLEGNHTVQLTASIGVAAFPEHAQDKHTLVKLADQTMYHSKHNGKNRVTVVPAIGYVEDAGKTAAQKRS